MKSPYPGLFRRPLHFDRKVKVGVWYIIKVLLHGIWHGKVNQTGEEMSVPIMHGNFNRKPPYRYSYS